MARFLAVGNLSSHSRLVNSTDMRIFFQNPEVEYLNVGPGPDIFSLQRRPAKLIIQDALDGAFELIFAGSNAFHYFNPRKNWAKNVSNLAWKILRHPNLLNGARFPYSKVGPRLVGLDLDDRPVVDNRWFQILDHGICFFKRELPQNPCNAFLYTTAKTECNGNILNFEKFRRRMKKLRPISLGVSPEVCSLLADINVTKETDVFFAGQTENRPNRLAGLSKIEQLKREDVKVDVALEKLPREEFLRRCARARIVWSPEGYGWDCFRHYEIAMAGSVPLMQSPTIQRHASLRDGEHALYYYVEGDHLTACIRQALKNRSRLTEMGQVARAHVLRWHTHAVLGRYVIEESRRSLAEITGGQMSGDGCKNKTFTFRRRCQNNAQ